MKKRNSGTTHSLTREAVITADKLLSDQFAVGQVEKKWLALALRCAFPDRSLVLEQLENCTVAIERTPWGRDLLFDYERAVKHLRDSSREIVGINVYKNVGAYTTALLLSWEKKVDEFYIFSADGSELDEDLAHYSDVDYEIAGYLADANGQIEAIYHGSLAKKFDLRLLDQVIERATRKRGEVAKLLESIIAEMREKFPSVAFSFYDSGPLSVSISVLLDEGSAFGCCGLVRVSALSDFFCAYVVDKTRHGAASNCYPNGEVMYEIRNRLYLEGIRPLSPRYLKTESSYQLKHVNSDKKLTICDYLFSGQRVLNFLGNA